MTRCEVVCLLPARNAAGDLPGFFASAARVCDAVVALDDGSTDETGALLRGNPLVATLLTNRTRPDYRTWDDAGNRNRLFEAAGALDPIWIISLDADERIDAGDAAALRQFLATDALPGCAYGFRHVPMRGDGERFLPRYQWVYRLFAYEPGQRFPDRRLHFPPIPTSIPRALWLRTTLRIQHLGGMTEERRSNRFQKYLEADPAREFQAEYGHLLHTPAPGELRRWEPRPAGLPVLLGEATGDRRQATEDTTEDQGDRGDLLLTPDACRLPPSLSAIVIAQNDEGTIARTVGSVVEQECPEPFEVIVVTSGRDRTAAIVRERFPEVTVVELPAPALPGEARNAGLRVARGTYVSFPGSHVELPPVSLAARLRAHRRGYAMVTGVALNGTPTRAGWASYFLDHAEGLPGQRPAELNGPPAHCSYARLPLLEVGGFPEGVRTGEDTAVNRALVRRGYVALRDPAVRFVHRSPCRTPWRLVRHHFRRGRGWGRLLLADYRDRGGLLNRQVLSSRLVHHLPRRLGRIRTNVGMAESEYQTAYRQARPLIALGAVASWLGMWFEVARPGPGKGAMLWGQPARLLLVVTVGPTEPAIALFRLDLVAREGRGILLPPSLLVTGADGVGRRLDEALGVDGDGPMRPGVVAAAVGLPAIDAIAGSAQALARLRLWRDGHRAGPLGPLMETWRGDLRTSLSRRDLLARIAHARRMRTWHIDEALFGNATGAELAAFGLAIRERLRVPASAQEEQVGPVGKGWLP